MIATRATRSRVKQLVSSAVKTTISSETSCNGLPDIEDAVVQSDSSLTSIAYEPAASASPSKKRKAPVRKASSPKKAKKIAEPLSQPPPPNWEEVYAEIKAMRVNIHAPVDTMGCEQLGKTESDPKNGRFATLVGLMLSSQTKDEVTFVATQGLREALGGSVSVEAMIATPIEVIEKAIGKVGFWRRKAQYLKQTAEKLKQDFDSDVPSTIEELCSLPGVGPKMGHLCLQVAWDINTGIGVDTHVHRITQLLGWHKKKPDTPEQTRMLLESWLPRDKWHEINYMLVGFGQVVCLPAHPRCDECMLATKKLCPSRRIVTGVRKAKARSGVLVKTESGIIEEEVKVKGEAELEDSITTGNLTTSSYFAKVEIKSEEVKEEPVS